VTAYYSNDFNDEALTRKIGPLFSVIGITISDRFDVDYFQQQNGRSLGHQGTT